MDGRAARVVVRSRSQECSKGKLHATTHRWQQRPEPWVVQRWAIRVVLPHWRSGLTHAVTVVRTAEWVLPVTNPSPHQCRPRVSNRKPEVPAEENLQEHPTPGSVIHGAGRPCGAREAALRCALASTYSGDPALSTRRLRGRAQIATMRIADPRGDAGLAGGLDSGPRCSRLRA